MLEIVEQGAGISREEADITIRATLRTLAERITRGRPFFFYRPLYNLRRRLLEWRLLPWCLGHGLPIMAYSPLEQGRMMLEHPVLRGWRSCRPGPACGQAPAAGGMLALR